MREAVQAALNHEPLLQSAYGSEDFYALDAGSHDDADRLVHRRWLPTATM